MQPLVYIRMWWPAVVKSEWKLRLDYGRPPHAYVVKSEWELRLDYGRSPHAYVNQRLQIQLELLMMNGMPLETCWVFNERWNNKFNYKVASCWLFIQSHTTVHGSMNIKFWLFIKCNNTFHFYMYTIFNCLYIFFITFFSFSLFWFRRNSLLPHYKVRNEKSLNSMY